MCLGSYNGQTALVIGYFIDDASDEVVPANDSKPLDCFAQVVITRELTAAVTCSIVKLLPGSILRLSRLSSLNHPFNKLAEVLPGPTQLVGHKSRPVVQFPVPKDWQKFLGVVAVNSIFDCLRYFHD